MIEVARESVLCAARDGPHSKGEQGWGAEWGPRPLSRHVPVCVLSHFSHV